jgi:hypothetical protein
MQLATHPDNHVTPRPALQDVQRTMGSIRFQAARWHVAGVPAEMHPYAQGGHAFGLQRTQLPITNWPQLLEEWLGTIGMIAK